MNTPNKLTTARLCLVPVFIFVYLYPFSSICNIPEFTILGANLTLIDLILAFIFIIASITDYFDGKIARRDNLITTFGKFVDPIADKLLVNSALLLLAYSGKIHILIVIIMISRDTIVDAIRLLASNHNQVLAASIYGKAKTMTQMIAIVLLLLNNMIFALVDFPMASLLITVAAVISVLSGVDYFVKNKDYILESM